MDTNKIKEDIAKLSITQSKLEHKIEKLRDIETKLEKVTNEKDDLEWEYGEYLIEKNIEFIKKYELDKDVIIEHKVYKMDGFWYLHLTGSQNNISIKFTILEDDTLELYCYWENNIVKIIGKNNLKNVFENNISTLEEYGFKKDESTYGYGDHKRKWYLLAENISNASVIEFLILEDGSLELCTYVKDKKLVYSSGVRYEE